jgi:hypothetical protein
MFPYHHSSSFQTETTLSTHSLQERDEVRASCSELVVSGHGTRIYALFGDAGCLNRRHRRCRSSLERRSPWGLGRACRRKCLLRNRRSCRCRLHPRRLCLCVDGARGHCTVCVCSLHLRSRRGLIPLSIMVRFVQLGLPVTTNTGGESRTLRY